MASDEEWFEAMKAKGHMPIVDDDGDLDTFVLEYEHHNGPGCAVCDWSCCQHCTRLEDIPECTVITLDAVKAIDQTK